MNDASSTNARPERVRFPLYAKIVCWFFLNLIFLGVAFYVFFKIQFRLGLDSLLAGKAGEHIEAVSEVISDELGQATRSDWDKLLKRFSAAYQVQFYLFRNDGTQQAGETIELPGPVRARLVEGRGPRPGPPGLPPPEGRGNELDWPQGAPPRPGPQGVGPGVPFPESRRPGPHPRFMVHTTDPSRYWVLIRMGVSEFGRPRPVPATLVAMSTSIRGGGLFFDFMPWAWVGFGVLFVSVLFWLPLVGGITRYISQMTRATEAIAEGRFDAPPQPGRRDELGRLSQAIQSMASRLSGFVNGQKRFLGDIAHELCSPLARMQVALGILEERAGPNQKGYVEDVKEEVQHMSSLVNELLAFSKAGLRQKEIKLQAVQLEPLVGRVVEREAAGGCQIAIEIDKSLRVLAEPELLSRALANLIRNAMRYAGQAGPISISAATAGGRVVISVADKGPGVPDQALQQIFDPFFRLESSRSRDTGGIGLGLSIVRTCIEACQGTVSARNREGGGLVVEVAVSQWVSEPVISNQ